MPPTRYVAGSAAASDPAARAAVRAAVRVYAGDERRRAAREREQHAPHDGRLDRAGRTQPRAERLIVRGAAAAAAATVLVDTFFNEVEHHLVLGVAHTKQTSVNGGGSLC